MKCLQFRQEKYARNLMFHINKEAEKHLAVLSIN